jgi:hypothetical protein
VLVGINEYRTTEFMDLRGAVNDIASMRRVLVERCDFPAENVAVLTDAAATRAGILGALGRLVEQTSPDDVVYVHFSGHGSQVEDLDGDEPDDGRDETILPHDARTEDVPDITDDEIGTFLGSLRAETAVIVLDSCHSGTATRGGLLARSVPPDTRIELYRKAKPEVAARAIVQLDKPERYVLMTGAASHQSALDGPVDGSYRGFFSYALAESLIVAGPTASPRDIHARVHQTFRRLSEQFGGIQLPEPQIEASSSLLDRALLPGERGAETTGGSASLPSAGPTKVSVLLDEIEPELKRRLEDQLREQLPDIEFAGAGEFARFIVDVTGGACVVHGAAGLTVVDEFHMTSEPKAAKRLAELFTRSLKASSLVALTHPASGLRIEAKVVGPDRLRVRRADAPRVPENSLMLEIRTNVDSYLTIVDVDAGGAVNVLFPNSYTKEGFCPDGRIRGGQAVRIPDSLQDGNRAGFFWDIRPPAGLDTIQVFASTDLGTARTIRRWLGEIPSASTRGAGAQAAGSDLDRLAGLRGDLARAVRTRGVRVVPDDSAAPGQPAAGQEPAADWNSVSVGIRIAE